MIFVDQTEFSSEDGTTHGNCLSACLASLIGIPLNGIPNFATIHSEGQKWFPVFTNVLKTNGFIFKGSYYFDETNGRRWEDLLAYSNGIDGVFIVGGKSPRTYVNLEHAVLYHKGIILHDPHPSKDGILTLKDAFIIEREK